MDRIFLQVNYDDRAVPKALGARWDGEARKWYVPPGLDVEPFAQWLPAGSQPSKSMALAAPVAVPRHLATATQRGVRLSEMLARVTAAVSTAFPASVWVIVEVVEVRVNKHVYLSVAERTSQGSLIARASAIIWEREAAAILPKFEAATGMSIGPGIKLLVRARPTFSGQHGFSLVIDALDSDYTLGDLEARKRELRERLTKDGLWDRNRKRDKPWDFNEVLVVSPDSAAGLGDFQAEASRLEAAGVCRFVYVHSRFQGPGAAGEIAAVGQRALDDWEGAAATPDVLVLIRGGGSVNDLAWLNDYALARFVCLAPVPVYTGIGHEKDNTVVDEVAHTRFDTPSKVIGGIENSIAARAREAGALYDLVASAARARLVEARRASEQAQGEIRTAAARGSQQAARRSDTLMDEVRSRAMRTVRSASELIREDLLGVRAQATTQVALARHEVPALLTRVGDNARAAVGAARAGAARRFDAVVERARAEAASARKETRQDIEAVVERAKAGAGSARKGTVLDMGDVARAGRQAVVRARSESDALFLEVSGQGPEKTLARGFAHVRDGEGRTVKSAAALQAGDAFSVTFRDGLVPARASNEEGKI